MREEAQKSGEGAAAKTVSENPEAGANMVLHKDSKWKESWNKFKEDSPIMQGNLTMFPNKVFYLSF